MFTGLIEEIGTLVSVQRTTRAQLLTIAAERVTDDLRIGDSLAVNGVCLTVVSIEGHRITVDVVPETVRRSTLQFATMGDPLNLERAMRADARFGGHIVAGHVDGVGVIRAVEREDIARLLTIAADREITRYVIEKGSIAIDGVSLTVMDVHETSFRVSVIPHTASVTTLAHARVGARVNLEVDMIGKYVEKLLGGYGASPSVPLTWERLRELGYD